MKNDNLMKGRITVSAIILGEQVQAKFKIK
jgi:hypothetical protein